MLLAILSFFIVLVPLIIIHELGHFFAAKSVGITVLEFGIGFPPRAATLFTKGETVYTLNWVPLGGFVRPLGEDMVRPMSQEDMAEDLKELESRGGQFEQKSMFDAGPWERIWFMFAGPLANFIAALFIFTLIGLTGIPQTVARVGLADVFAGSPAEAAGLQVGDVVTHVNGEEVENVAEFEDAVEGQDSITLTVEREGESFETTVVPGEFDAHGVEERVLITVLENPSPAYDAGLQLDDVVMAVDGESVINIEMLQEYTDEREGVPIEFSILRGTEILNLSITPIEMENDVRIGIGIEPAPLNKSIGATIANLEGEVKPIPADNPIDAVSYGVEVFGRTIKLVALAPIDIIRGDIPLSQARPASPILISQIGGEIIQRSIDEGVLYRILGFTGIISIALAVTNLLPIPGLDGGRILFVIFELLRGKPMEPEREGLVHLIGILFLLSIMIVVIAFEVIDPIDLSAF